MIEIRTDFAARAFNLRQCFRMGKINGGATLSTGLFAAEIGSAGILGIQYVGSIGRRYVLTASEPYPRGGAMRTSTARWTLVVSLGLTSLLSACQVPLPAGAASVNPQKAVLSAGGNHTCSIRNGEVLCWGQNSAGQLGDGTFDDKKVPTIVTVSGGKAVSVSAGFQHTCDLTDAGQVFCWGDNWAGQLGGKDNATGKLEAVSAGGSHTCVLTAAGGVRCWGGNKLGGLGNGTNVDSQVPVDVDGLTAGVQSFSAGMDYSCAVMANRAKCWGANDTGQLGDGSYNSANQPVTVTGLGNNIAAVTTGYFHTCTLTSEGDVWCWGENTAGELGDGTNAGSPSPVKTIGLEGGVLAIVAGGSHTCALTKTGGVKCWGDNSFGQLGDGTTAGRSTPADVAGLTGGVIAVAAGASHTCAMLTGGTVKCWGANGNGQLGDGTNVDRNTPVAVSAAG
jgi:alpha-tubulin suppressor-like RCC1 family protein